MTVVMKFCRVNGVKYKFVRGSIYCFEEGVQFKIKRGERTYQLTILIGEMVWMLDDEPVENVYLSTSLKIELLFECDHTQFQRLG